jgi:hypothetical protein
METLEQKIKRAIKLKSKKHIVYELFDKYELEFSKLKPEEKTKEKEKEYIKLYFIYLNYMNRKENRI